MTSKEEKTQNTKSSIESNKFFKNLKESITEWDKPFIMDASIYGNISKFINHSCAPNLFSQNVFIDTYDFRFPWIAFFASTTIKAGTELCWDYGYIIDSIKDRSLKCYCNSSKCRGRLLWISAINLINLNYFLQLFWKQIYRNTNTHTHIYTLTY